MTDLYNIFLSHPAVLTDSRTVAAGSLFFALRGENFDGNRFAADALGRGAAYAVVDDPACALSDRYIVVDDVLVALQQLAGRHRAELGIPILAITGSNGKTTTKELAERVLSTKYRVAATRGNLNNHIGVPLTLLAMDRDTQFGIVEMGASARGEIALLCRIAQPDYGLITNVGNAHLEGFGGLGGVRAGKGELYDYLADSGGEAFVPAWDDALTSMAAARPGLRVVEYGVVPGIVNEHLFGEYNKYNVAAAVAVGKRMGVGMADIREAVASYKPDNNRSQWKDTGRNLIVLDCYNANPTSMMAAIREFAKLATDRPKAVILGEMLELGDYSEAQHVAVADALSGARFDEVFLVGEGFAGVRDRFRTFATTDMLVDHLAANPLRDRVILIKGSRRVGLEKLEDKL